MVHSITRQVKRKRKVKRKGTQTLFGSIPIQFLSLFSLKLVYLTYVEEIIILMSSFKYLS